MIRRVAAHFVLGLRAPWRSRLVAALLVLLAATVLVLPAHLHSDGTPAGELRMLLTGTLGPAMAVLAAARAVGAPFRRAMELANVAAGIVVGKVGTAVVTPAELQAALGKK